MRWDIFWDVIKLYEESKKKVESNLNYIKFGSSCIRITRFQKIVMNGLFEVLNTVATDILATINNTVAYS